MEFESPVLDPTPEVEPVVPAAPCRPSRLWRAWYFLTCEENLRRYLFLLGPWLALLMVEILNKNNPFTALTPTQTTLNMLWYYSIFWVVRLITGRLLTASVVASGLCFFVGLANHYVLSFRGRIIFPCDLLALGTAANVAADYDYTPTKPVWIAAAILVLYWLVIALLAHLKPRRGRQKLRRWVMVSSLGLMAVYVYIFLFTSLLPSIGIYAQQWKTQANGFLLNFMAALRYSFVSAPDGYSASAAADIAQKYAPQAADDAAVQPENLIIIMN